MVLRFSRGCDRGSYHTRIGEMSEYEDKPDEYTSMKQWLLDGRCVHRGSCSLANRTRQVVASVFRCGWANSHGRQSVSFAEDNVYAAPACAGLLANAVVTHLAAIGQAREVLYTTPKRLLSAASAGSLGGRLVRQSKSSSQSVPLLFLSCENRCSCSV